MKDELEFEMIRNITAEVLDISDVRIGMSSRFTEDLGANSLDLMTILTMLEKKTGLDLDASVMTGIYTPRDVVERILDAYKRKDS